MTNPTWKERMKLAQRRCSEIIDLDQTPPVKYTAVYCNAALAELDDLDKLHQSAIDEARKEEREECIKIVRDIKNMSDDSSSIHWFNALHCVIKSLEKVYINQSLTKEK